MHRRLRAAISAACLLAACGSPSAVDPELVGPYAKADGEGPGALFVCRIERGEGDDFFRADTLRCELPGDATLRDVTLEVWSGDDHLGAGRLADGPLEQLFYADKYPIRVDAEAYAPVDDPIVGLDGVRVRTEMTVNEAEELASLRGPELPFEIWELRVESQLSLGIFRLDTYALTTDGPQLVERGEPTDSVEVSHGGELIRAGEVVRLRIAVPSGTEALTGTTSDGSNETPFTIDRGGRYLLTAGGLEPDVEPVRLEDPRFPFVSCYGFGVYEECRVVPRTGITIESAEIVVDGEPTSIPLDGDYADIPAGETHFARVVVSEGIDGIDLGRHGVIEGPLTPARYERIHPSEVAPDFAVLEAPFDLLQVIVNVEPGGTVILANDGYSVTFGTPVAGDTESTAPLSAVVTHEDPDVWIAVDRDADEVLADATILDASGGMTEHTGVALRSQALVATAEGLVPPPPADPVDEVIGCWIERGEDLHCGVSFRDDLEAATVTVNLDGAAGSGVVERSLLPALTAESIPVQDLDRFFPLTIELRATLAGQPETTSRIRILDADELPRSRRLVIDAG